MIDTGMIMANVATMLSNCFFKITSIWYMRSDYIAFAADFYLQKMRHGIPSPELRTKSSFKAANIAACIYMRKRRRKLLVAWNIFISHIDVPADSSFAKIQ